MTTIGDFEVSRATTGIGSLPHHNVDAALQFSFQLGIPFLPQIPIRNTWEYMVAQALEGLPGLRAEADGMVTLIPGIWQTRARELDQKLKEAFSAPATDRHAFENFEPSPAVSSSWQPFVWELEERGIRLAKVQIAGPMTAQWALRISTPGAPNGGDSIDKHPEIASQIYQLVLARAMAMVRRLQSHGVQPLIFIDEPGLYGLSTGNPRHVLALQELKIMIQTLRKEGAWVGLHCCSDTVWNSVLNLGLNYLSIDTGLSLDGLLGVDSIASFIEFVQGGGKLSLGVVPTARSSVLHSLRAKDLFEHIEATFRTHLPSSPELMRKVLREAIYTPACGLALHSVNDAELVLGVLNDFYDYIDRSLKGA